jgi:hypothetical protein
MARIGPGGSKERPPEHVQHRWPKDQAGENLTEYRRLSKPVRQGAGELGRRNDKRQNQQQLQ